MIIGIPKEVKSDENRVSLTPDKVDLLVKNDHRVLVQAGAGHGASFTDDDYTAVGASIVDEASSVFDEADMIVKVKEPQPQEYEMFRQDQILFTFLHLAPEPALTMALLKSKVAGVAYETVQEKDGSLPLLYPMSEIAGRLAPPCGRALASEPVRRSRQDDGRGSRHRAASHGRRRGRNGGLERGDGRFSPRNARHNCRHQPGSAPLHQHGLSRCG